MTPTLVAPPKMARGGRVAVLSPSWAAPAHFPAVHEQAMRRLRDVVGVEPVEYPTSRRDSAPQERASDLMAAFADTSIGAVLATIGGADQITVLPHLDPEVFRRHPKPFLGYSDNTNLLNWLWRHGLAALHGGSTQVHLGPGPDVSPLHLRSLEAALFDGGDLEVAPLTEFSEDGLDWGLPQALTDASPTRAAAPWVWHQTDRVVSAPTWGGCLEVVGWNLAAGRWILPTEAYARCVLLLETSEERPGADEVRRVLRTMGEWGLLAQFPAVVVAGPERATRPARGLTSPRGRPTRSGRPTTSGRPTVRTNAMRCCRSSRTTTRRQWRSSGSTSGTRARSGCCPTGGDSPSTGRPGGSSPTTDAGAGAGQAGFLPHPGRWGLAGPGRGAAHRQRHGAGCGRRRDRWGSHSRGEGLPGSQQRLPPRLGGVASHQGHRGGRSSRWTVIEVDGHRGGRGRVTRPCPPRRAAARHTLTNPPH